MCRLWPVWVAVNLQAALAARRGCLRGERLHLVGPAGPVGCRSRLSGRLWRLVGVVWPGGAWAGLCSFRGIQTRGRREAYPFWRALFGAVRVSRVGTALLVVLGVCGAILGLLGRFWACLQTSRASWRGLVLWGRGGGGPAGLSRAGEFHAGPARYCSRVGCWCLAWCGRLWRMRPAAPAPLHGPQRPGAKVPWTGGAGFRGNERPRPRGPGAHY